VTQGYYLIAYAVAVMLMMAFCPSGLCGLLGRVAKALRSNRAAGAAAPALEAEGTHP
jgi:hypothetical protein